MVWENGIYATLGDVIGGGHVTTVELPEDALEIALDKFDRGMELLESEPDENFVGPFANGEAGTKQVKARFYIPLPHRYTNIFLGKSVPLREAYIDLTTLMKAHGDDQKCPNLANWFVDGHHRHCRRSHFPARREHATPIGTRH